MKNLYRIWFLTVILVFSLCLLTACGGSDTDEKAGSGSPFAAADAGDTLDPLDIVGTAWEVDGTAYHFYEDGTAIIGGEYLGEYTWDGLAGTITLDGSTAELMYDEDGFFIEGEDGYYGGRKKVGPSEAPETHACGQHGYDFGVPCEFGGKKYDRDECEERRELVGEIRQEVNEIVDNRRFERRFKKRIELLVDIEHNDDGEQKHYREDISAEKLSYYISVEYLEHQSLLISFSTISVFHGLKSPAMIWRRASPTSHR